MQSGAFKVSFATAAHPARFHSAASDLFPSADPSLPLQPLSHTAVSLGRLCGPPLSALFYLLRPFTSLPLHLSAPSLCLPPPLTPFIFSCLPLICPRPFIYPSPFIPFLLLLLSRTFSLSPFTLAPIYFPVLLQPPVSPCAHSWKENWCRLKCEILIPALAEQQRGASARCLQTSTRSCKAAVVPIKLAVKMIHVCFCLCDSPPPHLLDMVYTASIIVIKS